jgi:type I restriction enzyme S subunit
LGTQRFSAAVCCRSQNDFLLPPLPEQRRIVAEIEKQFTRLEAGVAALGRVQANLKRYRAAVLKAACEGRLVTSDLKTWKRLKVSEIGETVTGNTPPTSDKENLGDELPFFKPTDLDAGYNVREARQYLSSKGANHARVLPAGAVLVTCIGATIGKTGFARVDCATNQQINALVVNPKVAISRWAFWLFSSPLGQQQIKTKASATTLPILNKSKFEALEFPIPPLAEQTRIVAEVERRLSVVEELELVVTANLQRATRLRQSILQKAFTGNL